MINDREALELLEVMYRWQGALKDPLVLIGLTLPIVMRLSLKCLTTAAKFLLSTLTLFLTLQNSTNMILKKAG